MVKNLPSAPSDGEKFLYLETKKGLFYAVGLITFLILSLGMFRFALAGAYSFFYFAYVIPLVLYLAFSYWLGIVSKNFNKAEYLWLSTYNDHHTIFPTIDIYLPSCGESLELIDNTLRHVKGMVTHYLNAKVYVLDDAKNKELESLAFSYGFNYITRENNYLKKAGNLRNAFPQTSGEFILILDADFAGRREMLFEMAQYMRDEKVAIVQTPQFFEVYTNTTWVDKGASFIQELFYRMIQSNRDHYGAAICVGTCALYRRKALEPFGGTAPIDYSEDVHTGFNVLKAGWKIRYIPVNYAKGTCPDNIKAFFMQQYRWCMGSMTLCSNPEFWKSNLTLPQKLCYLSGFSYYTTTACGTFLNIAPSLFLIYSEPNHIYWWTVFYSLPSFLFGTFGIAIWSRAKWGFYSPAAREVSYWAHLFAIIDKFTGKKMEWLPTNTLVKVQKWPIFITLFSSFSLASYGLLVYGVYLHRDLDFRNFLPMLFFASFYSFIRFGIIADLIRLKLKKTPG